MIYKNIEVTQSQKYGSLRFGLCEYGFDLNNNKHMIDADWFHYLSDIKNCKCKRKSR